MGRLCRLESFSDRRHPFLRSSVRRDASQHSDLTVFVRPTLLSAFFIGSNGCAGLMFFHEIDEYPFAGRPHRSRDCGTATGSKALTSFTHWPRVRLENDFVPADCLSGWVVRTLIVSKYAGTTVHCALAIAGNIHPRDERLSLWGAC